MEESSTAEFSFLVDLQLCAVTFIWDYYQFLIGTYTLSVYAHPSIQRHDKSSLAKDDPGYRDALCAQIGSGVVDARYSRSNLELCFKDGTRFLLSMRKEDRIGGGPESLVVSDPKGTLIVEGDSEVTGANVRA